MMREQLEYLRAVIEGRPLVEPWREWFERNESLLAANLTRGEFLRLKVNRIKAVPEVLTKFGVPFTRSTRYDWLGGVPGLCRDCGSTIEESFFVVRCPRGCFTTEMSR